MFLLFRVNVFFSPRAFLVGVHSLFKLPYKKDLLDHLYKFSRRGKKSPNFISERYREKLLHLNKKRKKRDCILMYHKQDRDVVHVTCGLCI